MSSHVTLSRPFKHAGTRIKTLASQCTTHPDPQASLLPVVVNLHLILANWSIAWGSPACLTLTLGNLRSQLSGKSCTDWQTIEYSMDECRYTMAIGRRHRDYGGLIHSSPRGFCVFTFQTCLNLVIRSSYPGTSHIQPGLRLIHNFMAWMVLHFLPSSKSPSIPLSWPTLTHCAAISTILLPRARCTKTRAIMPPLIGVTGQTHLTHLPCRR